MKDLLRVLYLYIYLYIYIYTYISLYVDIYRYLSIINPPNRAGGKVGCQTNGKPLSSQKTPCSSRLCGTIPLVVCVSWAALLSSASWLGPGYSQGTPEPCMSPSLKTLAKAQG